MEHFANVPDHREILYENDIEFQCKKGGGFQSYSANYFMPNKPNQDNFFVVTESDMKILGVFDGHGEFGHLVSSYASGIMLDYLRNKERVLRPRYLVD